jgi:hypothetical protein
MNTQQYTNFMSSPNPAVLFERSSPENFDELYNTYILEPEDDSNFAEDEEDTNLSLQIGQTFESFEEVEEFLTRYCEQKGLNTEKEELNMMMIMLYENVPMNVQKQLNTNQKRIRILKSIEIEVLLQLVVIGT